MLIHWLASFTTGAKNHNKRKTIVVRLERTSAACFRKRAHTWVRTCKISIIDKTKTTTTTLFDFCLSNYSYFIYLFFWLVTFFVVVVVVVLALFGILNIYNHMRYVRCGIRYHFGVQSVNIKHLSSRLTDLVCETKEKNIKRTTEII